MMGQSMILSFFGGVSQNRLDWAIDFDRVLLELARWLLPIGVCLLAEGFCLEKHEKIEPLSCYRYETTRVWWRRKFFGSLLYGMVATSVLFLGAMAVDGISLMNRAGSSLAAFPVDAWKVFLLWFAHVSTILSSFVVLDLTELKRLAPAILLLLESFTFLVGFTSAGAARFMYGMWGMYFQSGWYNGEAGLSVIFSMIAEGVLLILGYLAGIFITVNNKLK